VSSTIGHLATSQQNPLVHGGLESRSSRQAIGDRSDGTRSHTVSAQ
jgi:hypothetical protein